MTTQIKSISTNAGFLRNCNAEFDEGFTCIIGGRGTCKSTLIESIRFAFDSDSKKIDELIKKGGLIDSTLGPGSVKCEVLEKTVLGKSEFVLEREVGADTYIYQDGVREHSNRDILQNIEIFSQGDLQEITDQDNHDLRLSLIDRPHLAKIKELKKDREDNADKLKDVGKELRTIRDEISTLHQELQPAAELSEQLKKVQESCPELSPELEANQILFEKRNRIIEALASIDDLQGKAVSSFETIQYYINQISTNVEIVENEEQPETEEILKKISDMVSYLKDAATAVEKLQSCYLESSIIKLKKVFDEKNESFYRLRQEQQEINESLKQQQNLRRQIEHMEKLKKNLLSLKKKETNSLKEREVLRAKIAELDNKMFSLRIKEVEAINRDHGERVYLTMETNAGSTKFTEKLSSMLGGSRIRAQEDVALALAKTFSPAKIIDIVETGEGQSFAKILGRDLGQMNRVVSHLSVNPDLYDLETMELETRLDITMYDNGQPKPVETLSAGQKATALLPLVLRQLPYPLLFDQPEDDLDNHFIIESLVDEIHKLKSKRQLIFVTHNANIPVLGEADKIIVMSMKQPNEANSPESGSVDDRKGEIIKLLEGGVKAFKRRASKYSEILSKDKS